MHEVRKRSKRLLYQYEALPKKIQKIININKSGIDRFQEKAGEWHDTFAAIDFLSKQSFSGKIKPQILKLKEKEQKQFAALLLKKIYI